VVGTAIPASAQEVDIDFCTNFYPELCIGSDGEIDKALFPFVIDGAVIPGYTDPRYDLAVAALARHRAGDDTDGNGIPDSPEIAVCGAPGCLPEWAANAEVTEEEEKVITYPAGRPEESTSATVSLKGLNPKKLVSVFTLSTPIVNYFGAYPASGSATVTAGPEGPDFGIHRIVAVGTADGENAAAVKVWRLDVNKLESSTSTSTSTTAAPQPTVGGASQAPASGGSSSATTPARTGAQTAPWVFAGAAAVLVGSALVVGARRRQAKQ
jgi:hypothetical protein